MTERDPAIGQLSDRWVSFQAFQRAVDRPPLNVRFAVKALGIFPRRKPGDQRFTQYDLAWADEVRAYLDNLGNPAAPRG